jgi:hypothetical protein
MPTGFDLWKEVNGVNLMITRTMSVSDGRAAMLKWVSILAVVALLGLWAAVTQRK